MENKEAIENLKAATKEFNRALRESVNGRNKELNGTVYKFDLERGKAEPVKCPVSIEDNDIPDDGLEYFWIEYTEGEKPMKLAFFFRDYDKNTGNIHVIPGLFEEYEYKETSDFDKENPHVQVDTDKAKVEIKKPGEYCHPFSEPGCNGGWWVPMSDRIPINADYSIILDKIEHIDDIVELFEKFHNAELAVADNYIAELITEEGFKGLTCNKKSGDTKGKYRPIAYRDLALNGDKFTMYLTKVLYFCGLGFFIQYNCIRLGNRKENGYSLNEEKASLSLTNSTYKDVKEEFDKWKQGK